MNKNYKYANGQIYHLFNRGVAKQPIFRDAHDYQRLLNTFAYYLEANPAQKISEKSKRDLNQIITSPVKKPLVQILAYCLMPNHFHLLVKQLKNHGITIFAKRALNSYTRYFNVRHDRVGTIFQGKLKKVLVDNDSQLLHLSRYLHLNPYIDGLINKPSKYSWSSYQSYLTNQKNRLCAPKLILEMIGSNLDYKKFVEDYADYAKSLALIKHSQIE